MNNTEEYRQELLAAWEETYKKGQLTFWLLLSLRQEPLYVSELKNKIEEVTEGTISCEEQSLYRSLRKYYDLEIVEYDMREGNKGPERKYYKLTALGEELLNNFIQRNIKILYNPVLKNLIIC